MNQPQRYIRLKEMVRLSDFVRVATPEIVARSDGTLLEGAYRIRADKDGFISSAIDPGPDYKDIILLGDSVPENSFVHENERVHRVMERHLGALGCRARVLNGGLSGASSLHTLHVVTSKIIPLQPKLVILMNGVMDTESAVEVYSYWSNNEHIDPFVYQGEDLEDHKRREWCVGNYDNRARMLSCIGDVLGHYGIPLAVVTVHYRRPDPTDEFLQRFFSPVEYANCVERWIKINEASRKVCTMGGYKLLDAERVFEGVSGLLYDEIHMNTTGASVIGRWVADEILEFWAT